MIPTARKPKVLNIVPPLAGTEVRTSAGWFTRLRSTLRLQLGRAMLRGGCPGLIRSIEIRDSVTGQVLAVQVGALFTRLTVDGRDYWFSRFTGKLDGTGSGCS